MITHQTPNDDQDDPVGENMQNRLKNMFADQDPPSYASVREVTAMKARIQTLEAELAQQADHSATGTTSLINRQPHPSLSDLPAGKGQPQAADKSRWPRFLPAPVFEGDTEKTGTAKLLHQLVMATWLLPIIGLAVNFINPAVSPYVLPVVGVLIVVLSAIIFMNRTGKVRAGSILLVAINYLALTYLNYLGAGEPRPLILLSVIVIMISGLLLGGRASIFAAVLLAVQHTAILALASKGLIVAKISGSTPVTQNTLVTGVSYLLIGFMLHLAIRRIQTVVDQLRMDEIELDVRNRELQEFNKSLEQHVADRTHDLELATEVGRAVSERVGSLTEMLSHAAELIRSQYGLYYTQIYLMDASGRNLVLRAGTGDAGRELLMHGHRLSVSTGSLNGHAALSRTPMLVGDSQKSDNFLPNPLLPSTRSELAMPLIANDRVVGVLDMQSERPGSFSESNLSAYQVLAGQIAIAIQNSTLFGQAEEARLEVEEHVRRLTSEGWQDFLNAVDRSERIGYVYNQEEVLPVVEDGESTSANKLILPIQVLGSHIGEVQFADATHREWTNAEREIVQAALQHVEQHIENLRLLAQAEQYRAEAEQVSRRLTSEGWREFLRTKTELAGGYEYNQARIAPLNADQQKNLGRAMSFPLIIRDETIGELFVESSDYPGMNVNDVVTAIVGRLSDHIENLRLLESAEQKRLELETVATVSSTASTVLDPEMLLKSVVDLTKERFGLYHVHIYLVDENQAALLLEAGAGEVGRILVGQGHSIPMDAERSLVARAVRDRKAVIVNNVADEPDFLPNPLLPGTRAEMAVPMIVGDQILGVFDVQSDKASGFSDEDAKIYSTLAAQVAIALQNARLYVEQASTVTQLRELDRLKSSFLANMSHELRTPLNSILGFTDVMLEELDGPLTDHMDNDLRLIQKNGQHLLHLINDVLDMAKIESGRMNLNPEKFKVHSVLEEVTNITSTLASEKDVALCIEDESDTEIEIFADNTRLRQVMINLVNNSIKFTEHGRINLLAKPLEGGRVKITVRDNGIGIPPDKLETIFQEFTQVDASTTRKAGGTGLGLPISRRLVEMHGGRLWAESTGLPGEGSTFHVELPVEARITEIIEKQERPHVTSQSS